RPRPGGRRRAGERPAGRPLRHYPAEPACLLRCLRARQREGPQDRALPRLARGEDRRRAARGRRGLVTVIGEFNSLAAELIAFAEIGGKGPNLSARPAYF